MDNRRSREALGQFLDYLAEKGLMAANTVSARKAAASKIFGILEDDEAGDVTILDLDDVVVRFSNLHGKEYTPGSLTTYKSRLQSAMDDFKSYLANPLAFRPSVQNRARVKPKAATETAEPKALEGRPEPVRPTVAPMAVSNIVPIQIRSDLTVFIQGLPFDLSEAEARRIAAVVTAMAQP